MWSWRKYVTFILLMPLMACGFEPLYGDAAHRTTHTPLEGNLTIAGGDLREGQILRTSLEDKFNPEGLTTAHAQYHLHVDLTKTLIPSIVKSDGTIQRYDVTFVSNFILTQDGVKDPLFRGQLKLFGSYNVISNGEFATFMADRDVTDRTIAEMAEDYLLRISSYFATHPAS